MLAINMDLTLKFKHLCDFISAVVFAHFHFEKKTFFTKELLRVRRIIPPKQKKTPVNPAYRIPFNPTTRI